MMIGWAGWMKRTGWTLWIEWTGEPAEPGAVFISSSPSAKSTPSTQSTGPTPFPAAHSGIDVISVTSWAWIRIFAVMVPSGVVAVAV